MVISGVLLLVCFGFGGLRVLLREPCRLAVLRATSGTRKELDC